MNMTFTGGRESARALRQLPDAVRQRVLEELDELNWRCQ